MQRFELPDEARRGESDQLTSWSALGQMCPTPFRETLTVTTQRRVQQLVVRVAATPVGQAERIVTAFPAVPCPRVRCPVVQVKCAMCTICDVQCHRGMCIGQGSSHSVQQRSLLAACGNNIVLTCCTFDHILFQLGEFFFFK